MTQKCKLKCNIVKYKYLSIFTELLIINFLTKLLSKLSMNSIFAPEPNKGQAPASIQSQENELVKDKLISNSELEHLPQQVIQNLHQAISESEILTTTVKEARRILECDRVIIYTLAEPSQGRVVAEEVIPGWMKALGMVVEDSYFAEARYRDAKVEASENIRGANLTKGYSEHLQTLEVEAQLVAPILHEEELFGLLVAHHCAEPHQWQFQEIEFFKQLAAYAGFLLDHYGLSSNAASLKQQADTNNIWTQSYVELSQQLYQSPNREEILKIAVREVRYILNCDRVVVYSLNQERYGAVIAESVGPGWTKALGATIKDPCFESRYLEKYRDGRVRALANIYEAGMTQCYIDQLEKLEVKANLVTPIVNKGKLFGLLVAHQCSAPRNWQRDEIGWMTQIAAQVGLALEHVKLVEERDRLQQQAETETQWTQFFTDAITYIRQSLKEEDILKATVREVRRVLNCDRVVVYSLNQDRYGVVVAESVASGWTRALGKTIKDPCFEAKYLDKYRNGRVRAWENIYEAGMTQCYIEQLETIEVKANLVAPILNEGKLFGLLVAHQCSAPRAWQQYEIRWVAQIANQVGFALDNAKLLNNSASLQQQVNTDTQWMQLLKNFTQYLRQFSNREAILEASVEEARRVLNCDRAVVYSLNQDYYGEVIAESVAPGWTRALGVTISDPCFEVRYMEKYRHGRVKALDDIYQSGMTQCYLEQLDKLEVKANLVTPILIEDNIFGLLVAHYCSGPHQWQPEEIEFLSQLATQVGLVLDRALVVAEREKLQKQAEKEVQWTQHFTQAVQHIRQSLKQKDILDIAVEEVRRVLNCDRAVVYSLNRDRYGVVIAESVTPGWTRTLGITIEDPCFAVRYVEKYRDGRVKALDNIYEAGMTQCYLEQLEKLEVKANLVTPILNEGKLFGLLVAHQCSAPRVWQQYEIRWVTQIATQVGFALDNAKLLQELEQSSLTGNQISSQQQQAEALKQQVVEILGNSTTAYQTLSQEALRQSEAAIAVLHQIQEMTDAVRSQVADVRQVKLQEQHNTFKVQLVQETLNRFLHNLVAIQESVNNTVHKVKGLRQSSPKLLEKVNLIKDLGKQIAQQSMNITVALTRTGNIEQEYVVELTNTVLSSMQQLYEASGQIDPLLLAIETETREGAAIIDSGIKELVSGTELVKNSQQNLEQIVTANANISELVDKIARASENQIEVSSFTRKSVQEVASLANRISTHSLAITESFNQLAALAQRL
jgi:methyl-accepting chemotaxis protein PixJ